MLLLMAAASVGPRFSGLSNGVSAELATKLNRFSQEAKPNTHGGTELSSKHKVSGTRTGLRKWSGLSHRRTNRQAHKVARPVDQIFHFCALVFLFFESYQAPAGWHRILSSLPAPRENEGWWGEHYTVLFNTGKFYQQCWLHTWFFPSPLSLAWSSFLKPECCGELWEVGRLTSWACPEEKWIQIRSHESTAAVWLDNFIMLLSAKKKSWVHSSIIP